MARRRRSFFFDNINKRLLTDTTKNTKESKDEVDSGTTSNTQFATLKQVSQTIERSDIDDLGNVVLTSLADDQILRYDSSTSKWKNESLTLTSSLDALTDTSLTSLATNNYLVYNGSKWVNRSLDLSSYVTDTDIASYSTTTQMNTAIASSNTAMKSYVDTAVSGVVDSAPETLNTLNELAAALGDDANFATTTATNIGTKLAKSSNLSDLTNAATARTNLGLGTAATTASTDYATSAQGTKADTAHGWGNHASAGYLTGITSSQVTTALGYTPGTSSFSGSYNDLSNKPTIPSNTNQLTNGAGYITGITSSMVTTALGYTPGTSSFSGSYNDLSNKPTIPTNNNQLTNGAGYITNGANYNVNNVWLRENGDNAHVQLYGNSRQMVFRTDGTTEYSSGVGAYPFAWMYGGNASSNRRMLLNSSGSAWTSAQGWLWGADNDGSGSGLDADTLDGLQLNSSTTNNQANAVVRTNGSGYCDFGWINTVSGDRGSTIPSRIYGSNDAYIRYYDLASFRCFMNVPARSSTYGGREQSTTDTNYWIGSSGWGAVSFDSIFDYGSTFFDAWSNPSGQPSGTTHWTGFNALHYTNGSTRYGWTMTMGAGNNALLYVRGRWNSSGSWSKVWNASNDGSGSGLDADLLDGYQLTSQDRNNQANRVVRTQANGRIYGGQFYANDWFRPEGTSGLYFQSYGGGWNMTDTTWIRAYNGKAVYATNTIATTGNICAYYSDERLKSITGNIDNALDKVLSLDGFYYTENELAKELGYKNDKQQVGLSAQKVQSVLPEAVELAPVDYETHETDGTITSKSGENYLTVDYSRLVPLLVEAIKEQQKQIEELKEKLG